MSEYSPSKEALAEKECLYQETEHVLLGGKEKYRFPKEMERRLAALLDIHNVSEIIDCKGKIIIPGFIDTHAHAPQYAFTGTGMNLPLLQWLNTYTFPCEAKFKDMKFAAEVYQKSVARHLKNGTTTCSYFATLHLEASKLLVDIIHEQGQRAYVGKVSMDRNSPDYYMESTEDGIQHAKDFVHYCFEKETLELNEKLAPFVSHSACASSFSPSSIHQHENDSKGNLDISQHSTKTVDSSTNIECSVKLNRVLSKKDLLSMAPLERRLSLVDLDYQSSSLMQGERGYNDNGSYRPEDGSGESNTESSLSFEADEDSRRVDAEFGDHHHNYKIDYCDEDNDYYQKKISKSLRSSPPLGQSADDVTIINDTFTYLNASTFMYQIS